VRLEFRDKKIRHLVVVALFQPVLYFVGETMGLARTASNTAGIVLSMIPIAATVLAIPLLRERPSRSALGFIVLSTVGVVAVALAKSGVVPGAAGEDPVGLLWLFGAVAAAAFFNDLSRKHSGSFTALETTFAMTWVGMLTFGAIHLVASLAGGVPLRLPPSRAVPALLYLGVLSSVAAFFLMNWNLARLEASRATVFLNFVPVVAVTAGWGFRGERVGFTELGGTACIIAGVWGANLAPRATSRRPSPGRDGPRGPSLLRGTRP